MTIENVTEIKGMLARGYKPRDIAFFFGVNNGRISEIRSETKFFDVVPKENNLPSAGPYPALRDILN